jgi:hypothetical protein
MPVRSSMCFHRPLGSLKRAMEYVGIAWVIALIRTLAPAEIVFSSHPWSQLPHPIFQVFVELPTSVGMNKYFSLLELHCPRLKFA